MVSLRLTLLTALALLLPASGALASGLDVIRDCTDDEVMSKTYTQKEYRDALREFAADGDQYGNCRDIIRRAQAAALAARNDKGSSDGDARTGAGTGSGGGPGAIGSAPADEQLGKASARERKAVATARTTRSRPIELDKATVDPAKAGTVPGVSQVSDLPTPLVILLALLLAAALAVAGLRLRSLVDARRA